MSVTRLIICAVVFATQPDAAAPSPPAAVATAPSSTPAEPDTIAPPEVSPPIDIELAIREAYQNAENQQGPLDGRWRLAATDGTALFAFVMADPGGAPSSRASSPTSPAIEGAWRDLRRPGGSSASGLLDSVTHRADVVEIHFSEADPSLVTVVTLHADADGVWSGALLVGGVSRPVVMRRF